MISNVSFGSTYKVSSAMPNGLSKFWDFQRFAGNKEMQKGVQLHFEDGFDLKTRLYTASHTMFVPDSMDSEVEAFCANKGIKFEKLNVDKLMQPKAILDRIQDAPRGMKKVNVDAKKLVELAKNQQQNLTHCENDYNQYYYDNVDFMFKRGDKIPATTLWISPYGSNVEDTLGYIKTHGADALNNEQMFVEFNQTTDSPDHCVFFALKNMGVEEIPVYVDSDTEKLANALGILK